MSTLNVEGAEEEAGREETAPMEALVVRVPEQADSHSERMSRSVK